MPHRFVIVVLSFASLLSTPLRAQTVTSDPPSQNKAAEVPQPEKKICREQKRPGSRIAAKKVCKTANEWAKTQKDDESRVNDLFENKGTSYINEPTGMPK